MLLNECALIFLLAIPMYNAPINLQNQLHGGISVSQNLANSTNFPLKLSLILANFTNFLNRYRADAIGARVTFGLLLLLKELYAIYPISQSTDVS